ncbi:MAG: hypothetical protein ACR2HR_00220 [Euzebya sp.]
MLAGVLAFMLLAAGLAVAGESPQPGSHHDHGRFSSQTQGFPPQPSDMTSTSPVSAVAYEDAQTQAAVQIASADPRVAAALDEDAQLIGVHPVDAKAGGGQVVTWVLGHRPITLTATVRDGAVVAHESTPGEVWQPPLSAPERAQAISIARSRWQRLGHSEVTGLQGFVMHTMQADGSYPSNRMAYVTFAPHIDARPRLLTWVDLTTGRVTRSRVATGDTSAGAARGAQPEAVSSAAGRQGSVSWHDWTFDYEVSGRMDGIALTDVRFRNTEILQRASMPAMTVFYENDACGPFVDRLGGELTPVDWADGAEVVLREFTQYGQDWLELGVLDTLGEYVLYQSFYLGQDGQLDAHTFAKGLQCETDHAHYPFWRFDFDVSGAAGDQIVRMTPQGREVLATEFDLSAADAVDHRWQVRDVMTGDRVDLQFDDGSWNVPGQVVPESLYQTNRVSGRLYNAGDAGPWMYPAVTELPGNGRQPLDGQDVVLWYRGYLPHASVEGPELWHSTGVRLTVALSPGHFVRPE